MQSRHLLLLFLAGTQAAHVSRSRREAGPFFGNVVGSIASPFLNLLGLITGDTGSNSRPAPPPTYGAPAPTYHAAAPVYHAPAPTYHAPAPAYHAPAPAYHAPVHHAPAPQYHAPAPVYDPPAPKPEIVILPAPDLSHHAPAAVDSYGSPVAPAYVVSTPVEAPAEPPVYVAEEPPVYKPTTYDPAPVDIAPLARIVPEVTPAVVVAVVDVKSAPLTSEEPIESIEDIVDLRGVVDVKTEDPIARQPKAFSSEQVQINLVQVEQEKPVVVVEASFEGPEENIIIDLTNDAEFSTERNVGSDVPTGLVEGLVEIVEQPVEQSASLTFETDVIPVVVPVEQPAIPPPFEQAAEPSILFAEEPVTVAVLETTLSSLLEPVQVAQVAQVAQEGPVEVILFKPVEPVEVISFEGPAVPQDTFFIIADDEQSITTEASVPDVATPEPVTPIVAEQELRSLVQTVTSPPEEVSSFVETTTREVVLPFEEVEVFDLSSGDQEVAELIIAEVAGPTLVEQAELVQEIEKELIEELGEATVEKLEEELLQEVEEELIEEINAELVKEAEVELVEEIEEELEREVEELLVNEAELENELLEEANEVLEEIEEAQEVFLIDSSLVNTVTSTPKAPILRKVTFKIIDNDQTTERLPEDSDFTPVNLEEGLVDTFVSVETTAVAEVEREEEEKATESGVPEALSEDPAFQEIAAEAVQSDQRKRAYLPAYDPRAGRVYGHKYNDKYSNWYYYSRAGF